MKTKILYIPLMEYDLPPHMVSDYQSDMLFHGLRSLPDVDVLDYNRMWWMYASDKAKRPNDFKKIWGKGFTLYGLLPDDSNVDRGHTLDRIADKDFDLIIIPIHHTYNHQDAALSLQIDFFRQWYKKEQIIVVDGWDRDYIYEPAAKKSLYFKRELTPNHEHLAQPISFAIPEEKVVSKMLSSMSKDTHFARIVPVNHSWNSEHIKTYIYDDEEVYYNDYQSSFFAYTCKKGGWDCLRHYEIIANGCIPWFTDIEICPPKTLHNFPKELAIEAKKLKGVYPGTTVPYDPQQNTYLGTTELIQLGEKRGYVDYDELDFAQYDNIRLEMYTHLLNHMTTKALAKYVLGKAG